MPQLCSHPAAPPPASTTSEGILCGATYGRLVGMLMTTAYPDSHMDEGTYALLGAASFLGGAYPGLPSAVLGG